MATKVGTLPKTIPSPETGETLTRGVRPFKAPTTGRTSLWTCRVTIRSAMARVCMSETT